MTHKLAPQWIRVTTLKDVPAGEAKAVRLENGHSIAVFNVDGRIYATDINDAVLKKAKDGIYPIDLMQTYTNNYIKAGGTKTFSDYYTAAYDSVIVKSSLRDNVVFAQHNLATDSSFNEFHVKPHAL